MHFRDATLDDLPTIVAIYNSTIASRMVTADTDEVTVDSRRKWFDEHSPTKRPLWMVSVGQHEIGWVSFQSFYGRPAYNATVEISIYLDTAARGKGYGKEILNEAMKRCSPLGIKTLLGFIFAHNEPSIKLFKQAGFTEWANFPNVAELDGVERSLIILGKRLSS
ncbi:GNAT family N-acetyltransferase [Pseudochryseolinea flava]|uniref:N-acetyltransferase n=1 Tax=Pseudochryseolinea flava TaxID=2059302 RepID=A0A364Y039_9BACT|nr:GNAT family N-acetyltransferase [Pseudochryseolinea flava]RAV99429.1 N-acetyltransferase [Pseudochryseolinea flava]